MMMRNWCARALLVSALLNQEWLRSHYPVAGLNERAALVGLQMSDKDGVWKWLDGTVFANNQTQLYAH